MTCARKTVICVIEAANGDVVRGNNYCDNPQEKCPRMPGEDYTKCKTICKQQHHAEVNAINKFTGDPDGAVAYVIGHDRVCDECSRALKLAGIEEIVFI